MEWSGPGWRVAVADTGVEIGEGSGVTTVAGDEVAKLRLERRWLRWTLSHPDIGALRLPGIDRSQAAALRRAVARVALLPEIACAVAWHAALGGHIQSARSAQRWIPTEDLVAVGADRPAAGLASRVQAAGCQASLSPAERDAVAFAGTDLDALVTRTNEEIVAAELASQRGFFDTIEKSPLTDEQARAVVCFDNRVQVLAAAGSGKTSVMVARAAYAVSRGFVAPDRILLLAFNRAAADELGERVAARFAAAGIDSSGVRASTFHAFGLDVIGRATGEKPRLAPWLDHGQDVDVVLRIADELRQGSGSFRYRWDLYRLLLAHAPTNLEEHEPDAYDRASAQTGYRTMAGEVVRSHSERLIADFLYLNGVRYAYEQPYSVNEADTRHGQYRPDFYYPDIDVWHEHWALGRDGKPPASFVRYAESMAWKRQVHARNGTTLVESTWADVVFGEGLSKLQEELTGLGLHFDWHPDRPPATPWAKPMDHEDLAKVVRTFMVHVKSGAWTAADLDERLATQLGYLNGYRTRLFLSIFWPIHAEWERRLAADGSVDFEDMLTRAAHHLETGSVESPYDLVMVDEFQDASRARARLVRALLNRPGRFLLAVGDDWQSINRFAGADLSVMTDFEGWFGPGHQLSLTTTFRCSQTICDVARTFVVRNPAQFDKPMRSAQGDPGPAVRVIRADDPSRALASYLQELSAAVAAAGPPGARATVDVLGRYRFLADVMPARRPANLLVTFRTVHSAKGLEADYIVVVGMTTGTYGFPSAIADDPVLDVAMPSSQSFPHAEERRLFYVALTRARVAVTLITPPLQMSPFVVELLAHPGVVDMSGHKLPPIEVCPRCGIGTMHPRTGRYGQFLGCSDFPRCRYTRRA